MFNSGSCTTVLATCSDLQTFGVLTGLGATVTLGPTIGNGNGGGNNSVTGGNSFTRVVGINATSTLTTYGDDSFRGPIDFADKFTGTATACGAGNPACTTPSGGRSALQPRSPAALDRSRI